VYDTAFRLNFWLSSKVSEAICVVDGVEVVVVNKKDWVKVYLLLYDVVDS
jgi:hypothetical protein